MMAATTESASRLRRREPRGATWFISAAVAAGLVSTASGFAPSPPIHARALRSAQRRCNNNRPLMAIEGPMAISEILEAYQGVIPGWAAMSYYVHNHAGNDALWASFAVVGTHLHREKWGENYDEYLEMQAAEQEARADEDGEYDDEYDEEYDEYDFGFGFSDGGGRGSDEADGRAPRRSRGGPRRRAPMNRRLPPAKDYEEPW